MRNLQGWLMHPFRNRVALAVVLLAACTQAPPPEQVADEFVRAYFVQSDMGVAAKLASGGAKANLTAALQQIDAAGAKEPAKDIPAVKTSLVEKQSVASNAYRFVYQIDPGVPEAKPITATLQVTEESGRWYVSEFSQNP
jgi:hypothetical protein